LRHPAALLLNILLVTSQAPGHNGPMPYRDAPLTLLYRSDRAIAPRVFSAMEQEVRSVFSPTGIEIDFEAVTPELRVYVQAVIVRFQGDCRADAPLERRGPVRNNGEELGVTHIVNGRILPFADINCDTIRQIVGKPGVGQDQLLGRALGRVVGHELYHVLTGYTGHGHSGLAAAVFSRADLVAPHRAFAERDLARMIPSSQEDRASDSTSAGRCAAGRPRHAAFSFVPEVKPPTCPD